MSTAETTIAPRDFPAPPMDRLVRVELRKMVNTRSGRWLFIISAFITFGLAILIGIVGKEGDADFNDMMELCWLPLAVLLSIVGILAATGEWSQRTALTTFALVPQRERVVYAKLLGAGMLGVVALFLSLLASSIGTGMSGSSFNLDGAHVFQGLLLLELSILGGVAFGLLLMSPALAIVLSFVLPTIFSILGEAIKALDSTWDWLDPSRAQEPLTNADMSGDDWAKLGVSTFVWLVIPVIAGTIRTQRREAK